MTNGIDTGFRESRDHIPGVLQSCGVNNLDGVCKGGVEIFLKALSMRFMICLKENRGSMKGAISLCSTYSLFCASHFSLKG